MHLLLAISLVVSPIWPLGVNPLPGDPYVIADLDRLELAFIQDGEVRQVFPVAAGSKEKLTPVGEFTLTVKAADPYYRKKDIPGGDKDNPLGTRWLGFDARETDGRVYGIHGTNNPDSIGKRATAGCIRMNNADVEILFEELPLGTRIFVTRDGRDFGEIAAEQGAIPE
ncbi:L,D-transpeptidase [Alteribacter natronophilus]|nr:L,D-transpeptidase [Alteribacter natronophilus]